MNYSNDENIDYKRLYDKLKNAYTEKNLNTITSKVIGLFKNKKFEYLNDILKIVHEKEDKFDSKIGKSFSRLILMYHPDKLNYYIKEIDKSYKSGKYEGLLKFTHIFTMLDIDNTMTSKHLCDLECEFEQQYVWDYEQDGFTYFTEEDENNLDVEYTEEKVDNSFYSAVKRKIYGNISLDMPSLLLEDMEEIEMADYEIDNLDGIECCRNVLNLDLSGNNLSNIYELRNLKSLKELYLSNNQIGYIDAVIGLKGLRVIDISHNNIDDLSPLFSLNKLEYVNIIGNNYPESHLAILKSKGIMVIY